MKPVTKVIRTTEAKKKFYRNEEEQVKPVTKAPIAAINERDDEKKPKKVSIHK